MQCIRSTAIHHIRDSADPSSSTNGTAFRGLKRQLTGQFFSISPNRFCSFHLATYSTCESAFCIPEEPESYIDVWKERSQSQRNAFRCKYSTMQYSIRSVLEIFVSFSISVQPSSIAYRIRAIDRGRRLTASALGRPDHFDIKS